MNQPEKTFTLRFSIRALIPIEMWNDEEFDEDAYAAEWEAMIKPGMIRAVFSHLRTFDDWEAHVRNRGISPLDEVEIVLTRSYGSPSSDPTLQ